MRDLDEIDRDLRILAVIRKSLREFGAVGSTQLMDMLLDERLLTATT